eukprot:364838-Chlamydomonas_euryale.AAC.12
MPILPSVVLVSARGSYGVGERADLTTCLVVFTRLFWHKYELAAKCRAPVASRRQPCTSTTCGGGPQAGRSESNPIGRTLQLSDRDAGSRALVRRRFVKP